MTLGFKSLPADHQKRSGRKRLTPLEKAIRHALAARRRYLEMKEKYVQALAIDPGDSPALAEGKRKVAEARMEQVRAIETCRQMAKAATDPVTAEEAREKERQHRSQLNTLPLLGHSLESWLRLPEEQVRRPVGKQPLAIDLQFYRAQLDWEQAQKAVQEEAERAGAWPLDLDHYRDPTAGRRIGRPPLDQLGELDAKIRWLERRVEEFKAMPEEAFQWDGVGRKPIPRGKRIERYIKRIAAAQGEIQALAEQLSPVDALRRTRKVLRDELRMLERVAEEGSTVDILERSQELGERIAEVERKIAASTAE